MIAYIKGALLECREKSCVILTAGGVGYELALPAHTFSRLPARGVDVAFHTTLVVREDAMELFGFDTLAERQAFEILTAISRVGARTALAILSTYRPEDLRRVVADADVAALTRVAGIGQKTAQHILLELKYRLGQLQTAPATEAAPTPVFGDVLAAMLNLGYDEAECAPKIRMVLKEEPDLDVPAAIRQTLKALARSKE